MFDPTSLMYATPQRSDYNLPHLSDDDHDLIRFCEKLVGEGQSFKDDIGLEQTIEQALDYVNGRQIAMPTADKRHRARVVANMIRSNLERKIGQLTDTVPQFMVNSRSGQEEAAKTLQDTIKGIWQERQGQQFLTRSIYRAAVAGFCPATVLWDNDLDFGLGDIGLDSLMPEQMIVDPYLRSAYALQDRAEYVIIKTLRPLTAFREMYARGHLVTANRMFSQFPNRSPMERTQESSRIYRRPSRQSEPTINSAIPRAVEYRCYFKDRTVDPQQPQTQDKRPNYLFPGKRLIIWSGAVPLYDGPQSNWDGLYPVEILDWGIEADHAYGDSEVTGLVTLNAALNLLLSGIVDNSRLVNNPPWLIDEDALDPETEQDLAAYGDRPGWPIFKKPGSHVERNPPGEQSQLVFNTMRLLQGYLEQMMGTVDVIQGRQPGEVTSGIALESLATAAQITIRMQARAVESWLNRIGRLMISRIIQYYADERVFFGVSDFGNAERFVFNRKQFLSQMKILRYINEDAWRTSMQTLFRDLRFYTVQGSSLAGPKRERTGMAMTFAERGWMSGKEVLTTYEVPNPEEKIREADKEKIERQQFIQSQMPPPPMEGAPMPEVPEPKGRKILQSQMRTPAVQQGGPGGRV